MRSVRDPGGMQRDGARTDTAPAREVALHVENDLVAVDARMRIRARNRLGMRVGHARHERAYEEPGPGELASLILASHGVTGAQARVVALVLRGFATKQIVSQLAISQYTIQEHLRAVFDKLGVRSRQELAAVLMRPSSSS